MGVNSELLNFKDENDNEEIPEEKLSEIIDKLVETIEDADERQTELLANRLELQEKLTSLQSVMSQHEFELNKIDRDLGNYRIIKEALKQLSIAFYYQKLISENSEYYEKNLEDLSYFNRKISVAFNNVLSAQTDNDSKTLLGKKSDPKENSLQRLFSFIELKYDELMSELKNVEKISVSSQEFLSDEIKQKVEQIGKKIDSAIASEVSANTFESKAEKATEETDESSFSSEEISQIIERLTDTFEMIAAENEELEQGNKLALSEIEILNELIAKLQKQQTKIEEDYKLLMQELSIYKNKMTDKYAELYLPMKQIQLIDLIDQPHQKEFITLRTQLIDFLQNIFELEAESLSPVNNLRSLQVFLEQITNLQKKLKSRSELTSTDEKFLNYLLEGIEKFIVSIEEALTIFNLHLNQFKLSLGLNKIPFTKILLNEKVFDKNLLKPKDESNEKSELSATKLSM